MLRDGRGVDDLGAPLLADRSRSGYGHPVFLPLGARGAYRSGEEQSGLSNLLEHTGCLRVRLVRERGESLPVHEP